MAVKISLTSQIGKFELLLPDRPGELGVGDLVIIKCPNIRRLRVGVKSLGIRHFDDRTDPHLVASIGQIQILLGRFSRRLVGLDSFLQLHHSKIALLDIEGNLLALDSRKGELRWRYQLGATMHGTSPITYMLDGRQHVLVPAGTTLTAWALPQ